MNLRNRIEKLTRAASHQEPVKLVFPPDPVLIDLLVEALTGSDEYASIQDVFKAYYEGTHERP